MSAFKPLNPLLNSELRLAVMSVLIGLEAADFTFIKEKTKATAGNLSVQINKLAGSGYVDVKKSFKGNYPNTTCKITTARIDAFEEYIDDLKSYFANNG